MLARRLLDGRLLGEVVRDDEAGHAALVERDPVRAVDEMADLRRLGRLLDEFVCDVLEERHEVDLLLVAATEPGIRACCPTIASTG